MKRLLLLTFIAALTLGIKAQEEARYNYIHRTITRQADGSTTEQIKTSLTILTYWGANYNYGQTYIVFNPEFQEVRINEAYTVQKDGNRVELPERAIQDVLPSCAAKAADFNHLIERVVVHTGIEVGCTVFLDYTIVSKPGFNKYLDLTEPLDLTAPISEYRLTLNVPKAMNLRHLMTSPKGKIEPKKDEVNGSQRTIEYAVDNIPARSKDAFQVKDMTRHYNFFSTASDFKTELNEMFLSQMDPDLKAWGDNIVKTEPDGRKRFNQIRKYVAEEFEVVPVPMVLTNGLRPMQKVRRGAYLTHYEQAALLNQMLRAANIPSDVKAVFDPSLPKEFRTVRNAQKFLVTNKFGEKEVLMDPHNVSQTPRPELLVSADDEQANRPQILAINKVEVLSVGKDKLKDGRFLLELPQNNGGVSGWNMQMLPTLREVDFEIPSVIDEEAVYTIKVGEGVKLNAPGSMNASVEDAGSGAKFKTTLEKAEDGTITLRRHISLPKKTYTVEEYAKVREMLMLWLNPNQRRLLFTAE